MTGMRRKKSVCCNKMPPKQIKKSLKIGDVAKVLEKLLTVHSVKPNKEKEIRAVEIQLI